MKPSRIRPGSAAWPLLVALAATISLAVLLSQVSRPNDTVASLPLAQVTQSPTPLTEAVVPTAPETLVPQATATEEWPDPHITETFEATVLMGRTAVGATADQRLTERAWTQPPPPTGILDDPDTVFHYPSEDVLLENRWQNVVRVVDEIEYWATVYAGARYTDRAQGLVLVSYDGPIREYLTH